MSRTPTAATVEGSARAIALWLIACAGMVFAMTVIGAITRLTESGLSMVEWRPLIGTLPPLSEAEWQRVFDLYRETPEYRLRNAGMGLEAFKEIFFWEWFHRLWGRLIGIVFVVPLLYFWFAGRSRVWAGAWRDCWRSAPCRVCWAGSWSSAAWPTARRSATTGSPPISGWPS